MGMTTSISQERIFRDHYTEISESIKNISRKKITKRRHRLEGDPGAE